MTRPLFFSLVLSGTCVSVLLHAIQAFGQTPPVSQQLEDPKAADVRITGHVLEPESLEPNDERLGQLRMPPGFEVNVFARDLINPRMLAVAEDGTVYVTRRMVGDVMMLRDEDGDGQADTRQVVANRPNMHGIAIDGSTLYLVTIKELYSAQIKDDGTLGELELLIDDLPDAGQHPNRTVVMGPDGKLYLSAGSTCNACSEGNPENATLLQIEPDGSSHSIFASGLRNTIGFGFEPDSGRLYGMDHGIDWLGDNEQHEELNHIVKGKHYGWPYIYADGQFNPQDEPPGDISMQQWAERSIDPVGLYVPHSAPMQLAFYTGEQFPEEYRGDAYVAMRGSWNRNPPSGYEVLRIRFEEGKPAGFEPFITGFLIQDGDGWAQLGRLAGIAQASDGALLFSDDKNGIIYRVVYHEDGQADQGGSGPAYTNSRGAVIQVAATEEISATAEASSQLASEIFGASDTAPLSVKSSAFDSGTSIPEKYAAEKQNISPALMWDKGPAGTQSYVVIMEDPDVSQNPPFVHWILYNLPAETTALEEAIPGRPQLAKPKNALQGSNDYGSSGYFGPRPPVGESHSYHFQVFALDTMLDLPHGASRAELLSALEGHVLASGELMGTYQR